jgi:hypothetical protein
MPSLFWTGIKPLCFFLATVPRSSRWVGGNKCPRRGCGGPEYRSLPQIDGHADHVGIRYFSTNIVPLMTFAIGQVTTREVGCTKSFLSFGQRSRARLPVLERLSSTTRWATAEGNKRRRRDS